MQLAVAPDSLWPAGCERSRGSAVPYAHGGCAHRYPASVCYGDSASTHADTSSSDNRDPGHAGGHATPQGSLWQQVWAENQKTILLGFITVVIASILVGVFLKQFAATLVNWASRLFHFLFDRFASAPLLRLRYDKTYRKTLAAALQKLASSNIVIARCGWTRCTCRSG